MAQGKVTVNNLNLGQGSFPEVERKALFIGIGLANEGELLALNTQSDLDVLLGGDSSLKANVIAARQNGGENWEAYAMPIGSGTDWRDALDTALQTVSVELVGVLIPAVTASDLTAAYTKAEEVRTQQARRIIVLVATQGVDSETQTWSQYTTAQAAITTGVAAYRVAAVPLLHGNDLGVLVGRLCNRAASIADTPMRVATGPVLGLGATPVDMSGQTLTDATLATLDANRLSCIQHYTDYAGTYWGDCNLLDAPGGDFQVIEYLRPVDKAARAVRSLAIARVGNRTLNDSSASIESNKTYFMRPLREMSKSVEFAGQVFPGDIRPPSDDSITIVWPSLNAVEVYIKVQPWNCPKEITANLILDLSGAGV
ncbi:DUF2586 domain-containing protein [Cellvibrio sp. QJXJ]|uniref:DUF2586 domain-containing protein n=1 Tax=Cellvibrio sp. QJXJ TaxID=2964606 RepID=UPI0021C41BC8|nr:DUF2586 domain-containing protein [Cellvibrio sp. QJXJ]UUA73091.1 DUF2586 domain-containing protein [Cellvibrio sp. QJXJ]